MIIPEVRKYVAPDGRIWLAVITLVTGCAPGYSPFNDQNNYTVWQVIDPDGNMVTWNYSKRIYYGYDAARKAIKRRWAKELAK